LDQIAKFYGLPTPVPPVRGILPASTAQPSAKKLRLEAGRRQLEVTLNSREIILNGVKQWLAFPVVDVNDQLAVSRLDLSKTLEPMLRPELIKDLKPVETVVLDPGHGGHDKGAVSIFGNEKDFALDVCTRARPLLEAKGLKVVMTRASDVFIPLEQRARVANSLPNSIFVAVHFNAAPVNAWASGFEIFSLTPRGAPSMDEGLLSTRDLRDEPGNALDNASTALTSSIYHALLGNIPQADRGIKHQRFAVIRLAKVPSVLIEGGFVTNPSEVRLIAAPAWRQKLAEALVAGIEGYKALAEHHVPPKLVADYQRAMQPPGETPAVVTNGPGGAVPGVKTE
ncbi:MAG: N-acetylmuramoyl-L-alanine amidase, partial [Chthoniobacter sp.]|nr:N-acetylmuramoyl-L-alanine amidase [Chthoniobacter sp.]